MKILYIVQKNLKQLSRDKRNLFFIILFPAIFMLIFSIAFSGTAIEDTTVNMGVLNLDEGNHSQDLINTIEEVELNDNTSMFNIINLTSESEGNQKLQTESISAIMIIPKNYSSNIDNYTSSDNLGTIILKGDPTSTEYGISQGILSSIFAEYSSQIQEQVTGNKIKTINLEIESIEGTSSFTTFDYIAPGLIVFAILMTVTSVATNISKETEDGMLRRLKLSKMKSMDYVIGNLISWSLIGAVQVVILLIVASLMGFQWQGGISAIILAAVVGILTTISSVALALIIVSFTKSSDQASNLSAIIAVPLSFICGSFFPLPDAVIGTVNGHSLQVYELLPWNQAISAFREIFIFGGGLGEVLVNIVLIVLMGLILMIISIIFFNRKISQTS